MKSCDNYSDQQGDQTREMKSVELNLIGLVLILRKMTRLF